MISCSFLGGQDFLTGYISSDRLRPASHFNYISLAASIELATQCKCELVATVIETNSINPSSNVR